MQHSKKDRDKQFRGGSDSLQSAFPVTFIKRGKKSRSVNNFSRNISELRIKKDLEELSFRRPQCEFCRTRVLLPKGKADLLELKLIVSPTRGPYKGGHFDFELSIPPMYPYKAPKVTCLTKVYHPNICISSGEVSLSIIGNDWRPVLSVSSVLTALQLLFIEPNPDAPRNLEASYLFNTDRIEFNERVRYSLLGGTEFQGHSLPDHRMRLPCEVVDNIRRYPSKQEDESMSKRIPKRTLSPELYHEIEEHSAENCSPLATSSTQSFSGCSGKSMHHRNYIRSDTNSGKRLRKTINLLSDQLASASMHFSSHGT